MDSIASQLLGFVIDVQDVYSTRYLGKKEPFGMVLNNKTKIHKVFLIDLGNYIYPAGDMIHVS